MQKLNDSFIKSHGLNARRIRLHQRRILQSINHEINNDIAIQDFCRIENSTILSWSLVQETLSHIKGLEECLKWHQNHTVTCLPAAGAASRFFLEIQQFVNHVQKDLEFGVTLKPNIVTQQFPFLEKIQAHLLQTTEINVESILQIYTHCRHLIQEYASQPKLNVPATKEGDTFLQLKEEEQNQLFPCLGNALIVPYRLKKEVAKTLYQINPKGYEKWMVLEQNQDLSTIRFLRNGKPYFDENGQFSIVSAGHGELLHLFDPIANQFPQAHAIHIRNIDNIIGTDSEKVSQFHIPSQLFVHLRSLLEELRKHIPTLNFKETTKITDEKCLKLLSLVFFLKEKKQNKIKDAIEAHELYQNLSHLFYWPQLPTEITQEKLWKSILELCERPLSVLCVVEKQKGDVGGGPVIAKVSDGSIVKLCLEMPHANEEDSKKYFGEKGSCTHFNPALVFFEIRTHTSSASQGGKKVNFVQLFDERFWLMAKREYKGTPVCYHETVLYELLGNSATTNLVFVEVPRTLFKPHKSYLDCLLQDRNSYGFVKATPAKKTDSSSTT